ncbi:MAG: ParB N-terminal domain-containing protein [Candidatus Thorarchaeota archaeon]
MIKQKVFIKVGDKKIKVHCNYDELLPLDQFKPNPRNPNKHSDYQIDLLVKLFLGHGIRQSITVSNLSGLIVRGHGRLIAAKKAGLKEYPVDYQDYENDEMEFADLLADNRIAELSELDNVLLKDGLEWLDNGSFDMDLTAFDNDALEQLMTQFHIGNEDQKIEEKHVNQNNLIQCPKCVLEFEK